MLPVETDYHLRIIRSWMLIWFFRV